MIRNQAGSILLALTLSLYSPHSLAELYKWVDQNGEVHFSDTPPENEASSTVVPAETGNRVQYTGKSTTAAQPIMRPYDKSVYKLHLPETRYIWKREAGAATSDKIGIYHIGRACSTRGAIKAPEVFIRHKLLLPNENELAYSIKRVVEQLEYEAERTPLERLPRRLQATGGLSLHAEVTAMNLKACAASVGNDYLLKPVETIPASRFARNRVRLSIHWRLHGNREGEVLYETTTEGEYNGWKQSTRSPQAIIKAVEMAALNLFSDREFIAMLISGNAVATASTETTESPASMLDALSPTGYLMRAHATRALTEISQLRAASVQFFVSYGHWPGDLSIIGYGPSTFDGSDTIDFVRLESDGAIVAELKSRFGANKSLTLRPDFGESINSVVRWHCVSNLEQAYLPANCRTQP